LTKRTRIFIGILVAYALGVAFLMYRQLGDIDPRYRESAEDSLVDTAQLMAALVESASPDGTLHVDALAPVFRSLYARRFSADIYGVVKTRVELRMTVVDRQGTVVFDSRAVAEAAEDAGAPASAAASVTQVGADHSRWRDVFLALRGDYGARTTATSKEIRARR
jgi:two-component system sensor histidine kinase CreC